MIKPKHNIGDSIIIKFTVGTLSTFFLVKVLEAYWDNEWYYTIEGRHNHSNLIIKTSLEHSLRDYDESIVAENEIIEFNSSGNIIEKNKIEEQNKPPFEFTNNPKNKKTIYR